MNWLQITLAVLTVIVGIVLTIVVMKQETKSGQSAVTGANTFYGSNKSKTLDGVLSKATVILALIFIVLCTATSVVML